MPTKWRSLKRRIVAKSLKKCILYSTSLLTKHRKYTHIYICFSSQHYKFVPECASSKSTCEDRGFLGTVPVHVDPTELSRENFFMSSEPDDNIFASKRCSTADSVLYICTKCYTGCGHKSHRPYMNLVPLG